MFLKMLTPYLNPELSREVAASQINELFSMRKRRSEPPGGRRKHIARAGSSRHEQFN